MVRKSTLALMVFVALQSCAFASRAFAQSAADGKRLALIVTNEIYPETVNLSHCHSGGEIMSSTLRLLNFKTARVKDSGRAEFQSALEQFKKDVEAAGPDTVAFFYFCGMASHDDERNYMALNERMDVAERAAGITARTFDSRWRRAVIPQIGVQFREVTDGLAALKTKARFVVINSQYEADESALFVPGQVFSALGRPLLNAIDSDDYVIALSSALLAPNTSVDGIFNRVKARVAEVTNARNIPFFENRIAEGFVINATAQQVTLPVSAEDSARIEEPVWTSVKDSRSPQLLDAYLQRYPNGKHAAEARKQVEEAKRLAALTGTAPPVQAGAQRGRRVALVIGNGAYQKVNTLPNPANDARAFAAALKDLGFDSVGEGYDLGREAMTKAIRSFGEAAKGADWAVIYYAGHGMEVKGVNYLIPVDANLADENDTEDEAVSMNRLLDRLQDVNGIKVLILDACRDNPFAARMARRGGARGGTSGGLAKIDAESGALIAYATSPGATAADGEGDHSPYLTALLQHIGAPGRDIRIMFGSVFTSVATVTKKRQLPWISVQLGGENYSFKP